MSAPLVSIAVASIYKDKNGNRVNVPNRMARCAPDMRLALLKIGREVEAAGGGFYLSDLFRSYEMQLQAHLDYKTGKKKAFSPPPGSSMHEGGRAFDVDVAALKMPLERFWHIAASHGVVPIIGTPSTSIKECWHFERRGSHALLKSYYEAGKGTNMKPAQAMAVSAILAAGQTVDRFPDQTDAAIQCAVVRLGQDIGDIDGKVGRKTLAAVEACGVRVSNDREEVLAGLELVLQARFPEEWETIGVSFPIESYADEAVFWDGLEIPEDLSGGD